MKTTRRADFGMGIGFMVLAVFVFAAASRMLTVEKGIGPGDYPKVVAAGLFILGAILSIDSFLRGFPPRTERINKNAARRLVIFIAVSLFYVWVMRFIGFVAATLPFLCFGMTFFGYKKRKTMIIVSVGVTAAIYVIFRMIFLVMLPAFRLF